jgi:hypothetical protein
VVVNDPIGDARPEHVAGAAVMLVPENEQIDIELLRPLQDRSGDVMRGRAHDLAVCVYASGGQSIDERLYRISVCALDIIIGRAHAKASAARDVSGDDVPACHVKNVHGRTGQSSYLLGPGLC